MSKPNSLNSNTQGLRKGERTRLHLLQAAFECIARDGYYRTTFQTIADRANVSQPLVVKAFGEKEQIFPLVAQHLLERAVMRTETRLAQVKRTGIKAKLLAYFEVSVDMLVDDPDLAKFYVNLHYLSSYDSAAQKFNVMIREQAIRRIAGILAEEKKSPPNSILAQAACLHDYLTGFILNTISLGCEWDRRRLRLGLRKVLLESEPRT